MYTFALIKWCTDSVSSPGQEGQSHIRQSHWSAAKQRLDPILHLKEFLHYIQRCVFLPHVLVDLDVEDCMMQGGEHTSQRAPVTCRSAGAWLLIFCLTLHDTSFSISAAGGAHSKSARTDKQHCHCWMLHTHMQFNTTLEALGLWSAVCSRDGQPNSALPFKSYWKFLMFMPHLDAAYSFCWTLVKDSVWPSVPRWRDGNRSIDWLIK